MASRLKDMSYFDLKGLKKAAAFRGNTKLEQRIQDEMESRVEEGTVTKEEIIAAAYL